MLETEVVERASKPINSTHINRHVSILHQQGLAVSRNDHDEFMELDEKFHHAIYQSVTLPRAHCKESNEVRSPPRYFRSKHRPHCL
ncbi:MAG: FCD domain-containing protein [Verrucomicrobia bacterium]|nr:FCD domain-containing protein [Verrucomicrobiota bacterium]